jgi:hypothetical protein
LSGAHDFVPPPTDRSLPEEPRRDLHDGLRIFNPEVRAIVVREIKFRAAPTRVGFADRMAAAALCPRPTFLLQRRAGPAGTGRPLPKNNAAIPP